jgi:hypothetical protein
MMSTLIVPTTTVEKADTAEVPVMVRAMVRYRRSTP